MAAIVSSNATTQRVPFGLPSPSMIPLKIDGNGATYATATGGLPFDISALLNALAPTQEVTINPGDVIGAFGVSGGRYLAFGLAVGTATYNTTADISGNAGQPGSNKTTLATLPCTIRLTNGTTEFADGACSEVITGWLWVNRGGKN